MTSILTAEKICKYNQICKEELYEMTLKLKRHVESVCNMKLGSNSIMQYTLNESLESYLLGTDELD